MDDRPGGTDAAQFSHGGDIRQFSTQLVLMPDEDFGVFMSGNGIGAATLNDELTKELFDMFFPGPKAEETVHFGEGPDVSVPSFLAFSLGSASLPMPAWYGF